MIAARRAGLSRETFWELTPRELYDEIEAIRLRQQDQFDRDITLAWHIEVLHRQKRVPDLKRLLSQRTRRQTPSEMRGMLAHLSEQYKIPLRNKTTARARSHKRSTGTGKIAPPPPHAPPPTPKVTKPTPKPRPRPRPIPRVPRGR